MDGDSARCVKDMLFDGLKKIVRDGSFWLLFLAVEKHNYYKYETSFLFRIIYSPSRRNESMRKKQQ